MKERKNMWTHKAGAFLLAFTLVFTTLPWVSTEKTYATGADPIADWKVVGTEFVDDSGNGKTPVLHGVGDSTTNTRAQIVGNEVKLNKDYFKIDGNNDYFDLPEGQAFTISVVFKEPVDNTNNGVTEYFISRHKNQSQTNDQNLWQLSTWKHERFGFRRYTNTWTGTRIDGNFYNNKVQDGKWQRFTVTYSGTGTKLKTYVGGEDVTSLNAYNTIGNPKAMIGTGDIWLGRPLPQGSSDGTFKAMEGSLGQATIWKSELSKSDIEDLWKSDKERYELTDMPMVNVSVENVYKNSGSYTSINTTTKSLLKRSYVDKLADSDAPTGYNKFVKFINASGNDITDPILIKYDGSTTLRAVWENIDKTQLQAKVDEHWENKHQYFNETTASEKTEFDTALSNANTVLNDDEATQTEIDNALSSLNSAISDLDGAATDFTDLNTEIAKKTVKNEMKYKNATASKKTDYDTALTNAETATGVATKTQAEIDGLKTTLTNARNGLDGVATDFTDLDAEIAKKTVKNEMKYKNADASKKTAYDTALANAEAATGDTTKTQAEIDGLKTTLTNDRNGLDGVATDFTDLDAEIAKKTVKTKKKYIDADASKKTAYDTALANAEAATGDTTKTQAEIDGLKTTLTNARNNLNGGFDKSELEAEINKNTTVKASENYTSATSAKSGAYDSALITATTVLSNVTATESDIENALDALVKAREELNGKLKLEVDKSATVQSTEPYTSASATRKQAYDNALSNANTVLANNNATKTAIENALTTLKDATKGLDLMNEIGVKSSSGYALDKTGKTIKKIVRNTTVGVFKSNLELPTGATAYVVPSSEAAAVTSGTLSSVAKIDTDKVITGDVLVVLVDGKLIKFDLTIKRKSHSSSSHSSNSNSNNNNNSNSGTQNEEEKKPEPNSNFVDVEKGLWYEDSVQSMVKAGLMKGMGENHFSPYAKTTRGMMATMLFRLSKGKATNAKDLYDDVSSGQWYTDGVHWANGNGVVTGYGDGTFGPNDKVTREQLIAMMYRYAMNKGYNIVKGKSLDGFVDGNQVSSYAEPAMKWAVAEGLIKGIGENKLDPRAGATRAEVAAIFDRFMKKFMAK